MATPNLAARIDRAQSFAATYGTASLVVKEGSTVLATHTLAGFTITDNGTNAIAQSDPIPDVTIANDGTPDAVEMTKDGKTYSLNIGSEVTFVKTTYIAGEQSIANGITVAF